MHYKKKKVCPFFVHSRSISSQCLDREMKKKERRGTNE